MTTAHDDKAREREQFEAWAIKAHGKYTLSDPDAGSMWSAWQARAALSPASGQEAVAKLMDEAAETILEWGAYASEYMQNKYDLTGDVKRFRDKAAEYRAAPAQQVEAEKWISVTERLPELGVPVLVAVHWVKFREDEDGRPFEQFGVDVTEGQYRYSEHGSYMESFSGPHGDSADHITHWMPLPKQPAAGSNNGEKA